MKKRTKRANARKRKRLSYEAGQRPVGSSKYARKARYLARVGLFGFQVPEPKPWKSGRAAA
jgi:hypothetical protein